jgi:DNA-binding response OmpR family regulator
MLARKMAHELKNSLTPIRLTVEEILARSPIADRAFMEQASQVVIGEVESLQRRVRAFSEFAAEPSINAAPLDLGSILKERIQFLEKAHPDVHYQTAQTDDLPMAWADADQVKEILTNLLENAAEAAGSGGTVRATVDKDNGRLVFEVHDSGPGLSEDARQCLFEPTISFKKNGMGLGLSISRKNALLARRSWQLTVYWAEPDFVLYCLFRNRKLDPANMKVMATKKIFIVDDEANIGASLQIVLEGAGYSVLLCRSAAEFRAQMPKVWADAYLLDVRLPDGNGIDLLQALRRSYNLAPVIMISGHGTIADAVAATRAGAFDFLEKPLSRDRLLLVLKNALDQATLQIENARLRELVGEGPRMIAASPVFQRVVEQASQVARSDARVLLTGESGTGKELIAAHLHCMSPFASGPFIKVNCSYSC